MAGTFLPLLTEFVNMLVCPSSSITSNDISSLTTWTIANLHEIDPWMVLQESGCHGTGNRNLKKNLV